MRVAMTLLIHRNEGLCSSQENPSPRLSLCPLGAPPERRTGQGLVGQQDAVNPRSRRRISSAGPVLRPVCAHIEALEEKHDFLCDW
jgi:hypothetical protein